MAREKDREIGDEMAGNASWAAHLLQKGWSVELDFSEDSLARVDETLSSLYEFVDEKDREIEMYTEYLGAYVGEVIRRRLGGEWVWLQEKNCRVAALQYGGSALFPHELVRKRLTTGTGHTFTSLFEQLSAQAAGSRQTSKSAKSRNKKPPARRRKKSEGND